MTAATAIWPANGLPAIEADNPPHARHEHADLAAMASAMLESRRQRFPDLVKAETLAPAEADAEIALFEQIHAHWIWMTTGAGQPAPRLTIIDRCAALDRSIRTIAGIARQRGRFDDELTHQAQCVIALRWHADPRREDRLISLAAFHHQFRSPQRETPHVQ